MTVAEFASLEIQGHDEIRISGVASSPSGFVATGLPCIVATVSDDAIKVWPIAEHESHDGKIWFPIKDITFIAVIPEESPC